MRKIFLLVVILGLLLTACTADKSVEKNDIQTTNGDKEATSTHEETQLTDTLYLEDSNYYYINKLLDQQTNIYSVKWSVNNNKVAFVEGNPELQTGQLYLWNANENKPKKVAGIDDRICEIYWSPDGKYFFVDIGTSAQRLGRLVSTKDLDVVESFTYVGMPSWSRDASKIALGKVTEIAKDMLWEVNGTIDLAVYDVNNKELKVIMQGNENEYYLPEQWTSNGILRYKKYSFAGDETILSYIFPDKLGDLLVQEAGSPSKEYTAYLIQTGSSVSSASLFIKKDSEKNGYKELIENIHDLIDIKWSPHSKYLFVGVGGSELGFGDVFDTNGRRRMSFDYLTGPFWSPDGEKITYTVPVDIPTKAAVEGHFVTTNVRVEKVPQVFEFITTIARGTENVYYTVEDWQKDGKIKLFKRNNKEGTILEELYYDHALYIYAYNLATEKKQVITTIPDQEYSYFDLAPNGIWLSFVRITGSAGEAEYGIPVFLNLETNELRELDEEYGTLFWNAGWFNDSSKIMLNEQTILDLAKWSITTLNLPEDVKTLGARPAPDGSKIALLATTGDMKWEQGQPLSLYILDTKGNIMSKIDTDLLPYYSYNLMGPLPVNFTWLKDNETLILESWEQENYLADLYKINTSTGEIHKFIDKAMLPTVSPAGDKIVALGNDEWGKYSACTKVQVLDLAGNVVSELASKDLAVDYFISSKTLWLFDDSSVLIEGFTKKEKGSIKPLIKWDLSNNQTQIITLDENKQNLYSNYIFPLDIDMHKDGVNITYVQTGNFTNNP